MISFSLAAAPGTVRWRRRRTARWPSTQLAAAVAAGRGRGRYRGPGGRAGREPIPTCCCAPACPGHLTGSAVVVDPARERTLLMLHRKLGRWFQPGGHADGDANLAARRLPGGDRGDRHRGPARGRAGHRRRRPRGATCPTGVHLHLDVRYLVLAPPGAVAPGNHESPARSRWVDRAGLEQLAPAVDPSTRRLVHRGLDLARAWTSSAAGRQADGPRADPSSSRRRPGRRRSHLVDLGEGLDDRLDRVVELLVDAAAGRRGRCAGGRRSPGGCRGRCASRPARAAPPRGRSWLGGRVGLEVVEHRVELVVGPVDHRRPARPSVVALGGRRAGRRCASTVARAGGLGARRPGPVLEVVGVLSCGARR